MRMPYRNKMITLWVMLAVVVVTMFVFKFAEIRPTCLFKEDGNSMLMREEKYMIGKDNKTYSYSREMPLIFIGGVPRSGTTLMRAMLDAHPDVRCGQETRVIPRILQLRSHWLNSEKESLRLLEAGISKEVINNAIAEFCLEIIAKHGDPAPRLCNKDPLTLKMGTYVIELFPNAKYLFMVRDGRATVHSIISRKVTITGFDLSSYRQCLSKWNTAIDVMRDQCMEIGSERCMMVYYEQLVLHPEEWMRAILKFLDIPWNDSVLHHEEFINKPNGVPLSKVERSSDQVIKPVNTEALSKWVGEIPEEVVHDMAEIAPMLSTLGYDPYSNPPDYGKPDAWVQDNTSKLKANKALWENRAKEVLEILPAYQKESKSDEDNVNESSDHTNNIDYNNKNINNNQNRNGNGNGNADESSKKQKQKKQKQQKQLQRQYMNTRKQEDLQDSKIVQNDDPKSTVHQQNDGYLNDNRNNRNSLNEMIQPLKDTGDMNHQNGRI